ncbi:hypothetical protein ABIB40_001216 [Pedobacter sp. UYP30]|uniref:DUF4270 domain-containing protein n=1 Tax=Pedobacter sp. UYP30 TaxID=1756400 RepID=UPI003398BBD1
MNFIKQDLLTLLIGLFLFAGCKSTNNIGLDVDANTAIKGDLVDNQLVTSATVRSADISTAGLSRYPLGYMDDSVFGKTEASLALTVNPPAVNYDFGLSAQLDSVVLVLKLDSIEVGGSAIEPTKFYGDTTNSTYSIDVHQLSNAITIFKSNAPQPYNDEVLGNFTGKIKPTTPIKITNIVAGKADTLKSVSPQLRIKLSKEFFQTNVVEASTFITTSNAAFVTAFKGLSVSINKTSSTGVGGIAFVNLNGTNSYLQLVYKRTNDKATKDTLSVNYPIIGTSSTTTIAHDYTGTDIQTQLDNPATQYDVTYAQGLVGVKTRISFPMLKNFTATYGKAAINKAELVVPASTGTTAYPFGPLARLSLYRSDIAGQPAQLPDHSGIQGDPKDLSTAFGGYYDSLKNRYVFVVTNYVQALVDGKLTDYGAFLAPSALNEFQLIPTATAAGRTVIGSNGNAANKLKLNIYYTKIN